MTDRLQFLAFFMDDRRYGVHLCHVITVVRAVDHFPLPDTPPAVLGLIDYHGDVLPLVSLREKLGLPPRRVQLEDHFIVVRTPTRTIALAVDQVDAVVDGSDADLVDLGSYVQLPQIEGVIQLPDGLVLIHDLEHLLTAGEDAILARIEAEHTYRQC